MSLFCSLPANLINVLERGHACRAALHVRSSQGVEVSAGSALFDELREGTCWSDTGSSPPHPLT